MHGVIYRLVSRYYGWLWTNKSQGAICYCSVFVVLLFVCHFLFAVFQSARVGDPNIHEISRVRPHHEGLYTCVVGNGEN